MKNDKLHYVILESISLMKQKINERISKSRRCIGNITKDSVNKRVPG